MPFTPPPATRQLCFQERLVPARTRWLAPALQRTLSSVDQGADLFASILSSIPLQIVPLQQEIIGRFVEVGGEPARRMRHG